MKKINSIFLFILFFFLYSCSNLEIVLKDSNINNPYKNKTSLSFEGNNKELFVEEYFKYFGNVEKNQYSLFVSYKENTTNRIVKTNQVAEKTDYELIFNYRLYYIDKGCEMFSKEIITRFTFVAKSFGYNFGTDASLEKLYKSSFKNNFMKFISLMPNNNLPICTE